MGTRRSGTWALPRRVLTMLAVSGAFCALAHAETDGFARQTRSVAPHVHLIIRPNPTDAPYEGNSIVIEQSDALVVVDAGGAPVAGQHIVAAIKALSHKPVKVLAYTHYHGDHNLGAGAFLQAWPHLTIVSTDTTRSNMTGAPMKYIQTYAKDYAGEVEYAKTKVSDPKVEESIRTGWQRYVEVGPSLIAGYQDLRGYPATITFSERLSIPDAETPVELLFLGKANTDGDAVAWIPSEHVLCSGDIVVSPIPYAAASYPGEWIEVLRRLETYDYQVLVPGHGEPLTGHTYLDRLIATLEDVQRQVTPLAKGGVSLDEVYKRTNFEPLKAEFVGEDSWLRALFNDFFLHSIIKNAYFEATGQAIVQGTS